MSKPSPDMAAYGRFRPIGIAGHDQPHHVLMIRIGGPQASFVEKALKEKAVDGDVQPLEKFGDHGIARSFDDLPVRFCQSNTNWFPPDAFGAGRAEG